MHSSPAASLVTDPPSRTDTVIMGAMGLGSAFPCIAAIMQGKAAAESILYVIDRVPPIDSGSEQGRRLKHEEVK